MKIHVVETCLVTYVHFADKSKIQSCGKHVRWNQSSSLFFIYFLFNLSTRKLHTHTHEKKITNKLKCNNLQNEIITGKKARKKQAKLTEKNHSTNPQITIIKQNKSALKGNKISNLHFVYPELVFQKSEIGSKTVFNLQVKRQKHTPITRHLQRKVYLWTDIYWRNSVQPNEHSDVNK